MGKHAHKLEQEARGLIGKNWSKSSLTNQKLLGEVARIAEFAASRGLQSINHLGSKDVTAFFDALREKGLSNSTLCNYATAMREIASAIGKQNIVPRTNEELGINRANRYNPKDANTEKLSQVREVLAAKAEWMALACDMQKAFGLRLKESLLSNKTVEINGEKRLVVEGAKGGRERTVEVDKEKAAVLDRVNEYIAKSGGKSLLPPEKTLKQAYKAFANAHHRAGGIKENGANAHLWRHHDAQQKAKNGHSDKEIAEHLGHGRSSVVKFYR